ncbi:MAG: NTP transferase domain-containing protein, partial [Nitrospirales bacterium]
RGSVTSLWVARGELDDDAVIMDADVLFDREILRRLVTSSWPTALLMDETVSQKTEECMVVVRGGRVVALTKLMPARYDLAGEGVGFLKVRRADQDSLAASVRRSIDRGDLDMEYEDALLEFFGQVRVGYEKIGGLPWIEIDFPEDVERAEREILPKLG